ncbi:MAG TPA: sigma-70 family RNA polymerase sigma factor [Micromonosporaceae bacterium]|nr:sigma-70 family RNA polymerase sigma factor [Micromonosporaceae bacterium]
MTGSDDPPSRVAFGTQANNSRDWHGRLAQLLVSARAGDREAISELVRALTPLLWNAARAEGLDRELAEDAVQNAWLSLVRSSDNIRSPQALTSWLLTVTRRAARELSIRHARQRTVDPELLTGLPSQDPSTEERMVEDERHRRLWSNVERLPPRCRQLLRIIAFVERPDYDLVSHELRMPKGSIGPTRGRCLSKLRRLLAADPGWSSP